VSAFARKNYPIKIALMNNSEFNLMEEGETENRLSNLLETHVATQHFFYEQL
jgi:hypothetical protein